MSQTEYAESFAILDGHQYMNIISFYENGRGVKTPVWFAEIDGRLYVTTQATSYKVKRIRATGRVEVGPSDARGNPQGPVVKAEARVLDEGRESALIETAMKALRKKYGLLFRAFMLMARFRNAEGAILEIWLPDSA